MELQGRSRKRAETFLPDPRPLTAQTALLNVVVAEVVPERQGAPQPGAGIGRAVL